MAIIHYEHFDLYGVGFGNSTAGSNVRTFLTQRGYTTFGLGMGITDISPRTGNCCLTLNSGASSTSITKAFTPRSTLGVGVAVNSALMITSTSSASNHVGFGTATDNFAIRICLNANGVISVYQGNAGTLLANSLPNSYSAGDTYFWLETKVITGTGNASVEVRVNGVEVLNIPNLTINPITTTRLGHNGPNNNVVVRFDDWIVWDNTSSVNNDWIGDTFVIVSPPISDGPLNDWVPSVGSNRWETVDDFIPNDADFIRADAVGNIQEFSNAALNLPIGAVTAIGVQTRAFKTDSGASSIRIGLNSNGITSMEPERALATGPVVIDHIANLNPNGNVPWTQNTASNARIRIERTA